MQIKTILIVILAVLCVALASVLGYQKLTKPEVIQKAQEETAGLKTYRNEKYGFEFQYQYTQFSIAYVNEREDTLHFQIVMHTKDYNGMGQGAALTMGIYDNGDMYDCSDKEKTGRYVMIDNKKYEKCFSFQQDAGNIQGLWITFRKENFDYSFELDDTDAFDQMLSTFKFVK